MIDGHVLGNVQKFSVNMAANDVVTIDLRLIVDQFEITGDRLILRMDPADDALKSAIADKV